MSIVQVKPIEKVKWHGKTGEDDFTRPKKGQIAMDRDTGRWKTGLTEEEIIEYGKKLNLNLSDAYDPEDTDSFWVSSQGALVLNNSTMIFDTSKPRDYVKVANLKASERVANSLKEYEEGKFPFATHVIFDEESETAIKATKIQLNQRAFAIVMKMSLDEKCDVVQILANKNIRGRSANFADVEIQALIDKDPAEFIRCATLDKGNITIHALILEALDKNILTREGSAIMYMGNVLAMNEEDAITYFEEPNNQNLKTTMLSKVLGLRKNTIVKPKPETVKTSVVETIVVPVETVNAPVVEEKKVEDKEKK